MFHWILKTKLKRNLLHLLGRIGIFILGVIGTLLSSNSMDTIAGYNPGTQLDSSESILWGFVCLFDHISTLTPPVVGKEPRTLLTERETLQSVSKRRVEVQVKCFTHTFSERFLVGWRVTKMIPQKCDRSCHYVVLFHIVRRGFHMWEESQTIGYFDFSRPSHIFCNLWKHDNDMSDRLQGLVDN